jgi:hypothetical protein
MISLLFIVLAAICNAIMDKTQFHYHRSIFYSMGLDRYWWNGAISWRNKYVDHDVTRGRRKLLESHINYPVQLTDAFHFFKMLMIIFVCCSIITFNPCDAFVNCSMGILNFSIILLVYGIFWNTTFSLFFKHILDYDSVD